jgi:hypothetical protein
MLNLALTAVLLVAFGAILFGVRYMRREAFLPYHADVVGKSWGEIDAGVQVIILGMLKIIGAGFATLFIMAVLCASRGRALGALGDPDRIGCRARSHAVCRHQAARVPARSANAGKTDGRHDSADCRRRRIVPAGTMTYFVASDA